MTLWPSMAEHFNVADRLFGAEGRRRVLDWLDGQDALINEPNMLLHNPHLARRGISPITLHLLRHSVEQVARLVYNASVLAVWRFLNERAKSKCIRLGCNSHVRTMSTNDLCGRFSPLHSSAADGVS